MTDVFREIVQVRERGEDCALCTVIRASGSTPGKQAMKMLVRADGSATGSVGGGRVEALVVEAALTSLRNERSRTLSFSLSEAEGHDGGFLCGGQVEIFVEPITQPRAYLFGGGHVSGAIAPLARRVGFHVTVGDDREAFVTAERHPDAQKLRCGSFGELARSIAPAEGAFVVVATRGHEPDGEVLRALSEAGCRPRYLAMIGSRAKRVKLFERLAAQGVSEEFLARVRSPMGLPIGARDSEEIAVSVVAEMIAVRRGAELAGDP